LEIELTISRGRERDDAINAAIRRILPAAAHQSSGILVTRVSPSSILVRVAGDVPAGQIAKRCLWKQEGHGEP
jgi:hypothetical protein